MNCLKIVFSCVLVLCIISCSTGDNIEAQIKLGANNFEDYLYKLKNKNVALLVNQSSLVEDVHLVDTLLNLNVNIKTIFAPEHGFRGKKDAGELVNDNTDSETGISIVSLYGKKKRPTQAQLKDIDIVLFDLQDVGVRFYTYISSMHYMMEACAENDVEFIVLDRPNPNGDYFAGPVLKKTFKSFVGMHPIPVVHGLTVGELANMINGEGWLKDSLSCKLHVVKAKNWSHDSIYKLPVKPSPNLPNSLSIRLYPSLCFFEATDVSIGRGTYFPFQVIGFPDTIGGTFSFTPNSIEGMAKNPKQNGITCYGIDLRNTNEDYKFSLSYFLSFYKQFKDHPYYSLNEQWFNLLAGNDELIRDIKAGKSLREIEKSWCEELSNYSDLRDKYLLYPKESHSSL